MYSQEVYDIIERLKDKVKDKSLANDINMLSLYSEMRSNALYDFDRKVKAQESHITDLVDNLDSAEAAMDNMEVSNKKLQGMFFQAARAVAEGQKKKSIMDIDED